MAVQNEDNDFDLLSKCSNVSNCCNLFITINWLINRYVNPLYDTFKNNYNNAKIQLASLFISGLSFNKQISYTDLPRHSSLEF